MPGLPVIVDPRCTTTGHMSTHTRSVQPSSTRAVSTATPRTRDQVRAGTRRTAARSAGTLDPTASSWAASSSTPTTTFVQTTPSSPEGIVASATTCTTTAAATIHAYRVSPAREVVADEHVCEREEPHGERERREHVSALRVVRPVRQRDQPRAGRRVDEREQAAESGGREQRTAEDVLRFLAARLPGSRARKEHGQDRCGEEEADARERRRGRIGAGVVRRRSAP